MSLSRPAGWLAGTYLILKGHVILARADQQGAEVEVAHLDQGGYFDEQCLMSGAASDVTRIAAKDLELLILDSGGLAGMLERMLHLSRDRRRVAVPPRGYCGL